MSSQVYHEEGSPSTWSIQMDSCATCGGNLMEFGRHADTMQVREVNGTHRGYCCNECANLDEYSWVKFGMSHKDAKTYLDVNLE